MNISRDDTLAAPVVFGNLVVPGIISINEPSAAGLIHHIYCDGTVTDRITGATATGSPQASGSPPGSVAEISAFGPNSHVSYSFSISGASFTSAGVPEDYTIAAWIRSTSTDDGWLLGWIDSGGAYSGMSRVSHCFTVIMSVVFVLPFRLFSPGLIVTWSSIYARVQWLFHASDKYSANERWYMASCEYGARWYGRCIHRYWLACVSRWSCHFWVWHQHYAIGDHYTIEWCCVCH